MSRLTRSEIETLIDDLIVAHPIYTPQLRALREQSLSQEAVRDEADAGLFGAGRMLGFTMGLEAAKKVCEECRVLILGDPAAKQGAVMIARETGRDLARQIEALKREPSAAGRSDLVQVTRAFLESLQCPNPNCAGGWITNTGPEPQHDSCPWCEARDRFLAGDIPLAPGASDD